MKKDLAHSVKEIEAMQKRLNQKLEEKIISVEKNSQLILENAKNSVQKKIEAYEFDISSEVEKRTKKSEGNFLEKKNFLKQTIRKIGSIFWKSNSKTDKSKGKK